LVGAVVPAAGEIEDASHEGGVGKRTRMKGLGEKGDALFACFAVLGDRVQMRPVR